MRWARELDPSRLIDEASGFPRHGFGDVLDCHGGIPPRDAHRISIDSETCGFGLTVPGHSWPGKGWATGTYDPQRDGMTRGAYDALYPLDEKAKRWYTRELVDFYRFLPREGERCGMSGYSRSHPVDVIVGRRRSRHRKGHRRHTGRGDSICSLVGEAIRPGIIIRRRVTETAVVGQSQGPIGWATD